MVSDSDLVTRLREILRSSDLETATPTSVRRQLEAYFGVELTDKKAFVREQIDAFLESDAVVESKPEEEEDCNGDENDEQGSENDEDKTERPVEAKKRRGGFNKICQLSPKLEKFLGTSQLARTEVVKKTWEYIRKHDLQDPKNRRNIICDESLHSLFRVKTINMFQMTKALSKHIWPLNGDGCVSSLKEEDEDETSMERDEEEVQNEDESDEVVERNVGKRKKRKPAKPEEKPKKKGGGFTKVCSLSPELQAFTGTPQLARTEVVKMLWRYIKENNLQDPSDKRTIICDESLRSLFPVESINMFQMNKHLAKHIWPLVQEGEEAGTANDPEKGKQKIEVDQDNDEANEKEDIFI
uniref:Upstream activation factor subunit spp27 n=1 Tax=Noccaea caerulescens TaxID=107243 RepID=A0A1J3HPM7_NOCCA